MINKEDFYLRRVSYYFHKSSLLIVNADRRTECGFFKHSFSFRWDLKNLKHCCVMYRFGLFNLFFSFPSWLRSILLLYQNWRDLCDGDAAQSKRSSNDYEVSYSSASIQRQQTLTRQVLFDKETGNDETLFESRDSEEFMRIYLDIITKTSQTFSLFVVESYGDVSFYEFTYLLAPFRSHGGCFILRICLLACPFSLPRGMCGEIICSCFILGPNCISREEEIWNVWVCEWLNIKISILFECIAFFFFHFFLNDFH